MSADASRKIFGIGLLPVGLGLCALAALWKMEKDEDGAAVAMSPFLAALAIEVGIFFLRHHQGALLAEKWSKS